MSRELWKIYKGKPHNNIRIENINLDMRLTFIALLFIAVFNFIGREANASIESAGPTDTTLTKLKSKKAATDKYLKGHGKALIILVKLTGKKTLVPVKNEEWPDDIEYTYNILNDGSGRVILISQIPFSESGDWFITYTHYFDENGKTYAFEKRTNVFDSDVKGGVLYETLTKYYQADFREIGRLYTLKDKAGRSIKNTGHVNMYYYKYDVFKNVEDCLKNYHIILP